MSSRYSSSKTSIRPHTSPAPKRLSLRQAIAEEEATPNDEHEIELLEYEWPDLPPIPSFKEAITRQSVSRGISYLLPVDMGRNSINHHYRTNLRAMFQEPYASAEKNYDDARETLSSKIHFRCNTIDNLWTKRHANQLTVTLNSECEKSRKLYVQSAPSGNGARRMGIDSSKLRKRSNLFLPVKSKIPPEAIKMRKEAERLAKSVQEDIDDEFDETRNREPSVSTDKEDTKKETTTLLDRRRSQRRDTLIPATRLQRFDSILSYEEFKKANLSKPEIPGSLRSPFLSDERNQYIWDWLHRGEEINEFQYFLAMCG